MAEQVGVNAPGTENSTTLRPSKISSVVMACTPSRTTLSVAEGTVFTEVLLQGFVKPAEAVQETNRKVQEHRERDQETKVRTAGSTFKNPPGHSSWKLIDAAGCRGLKVGNVRMSEKHCNFLIAEEGATAAEIEALGELVRARVKATSGVELDWEVKRVGVLR